jgi:hypothetical protein
MTYLTDLVAACEASKLEAQRTIAAGHTAHERAEGARLLAVAIRDQLNAVEIITGVLQALYLGLLKAPTA